MPQDKTPLVPFFMMPFLMVIVPFPVTTGMSGTGFPSDISSVKLPEGTADFNRCEIRFKDNTRVEISERERDLLRYLAQNAERAVSREEILSHVWRINPDRVETRTVDMHIARLREKVRDNGTEPDIILTVRGKGYMFKKVKDD